MSSHLYSSAVRGDVGNKGQIFTLSKCGNNYTTNLVKQTNSSPNEVGLFLTNAQADCSSLHRYLYTIPCHLPRYQGQHFPYISFSLTDNVSKKIHLLLWIMRSILHKRIRVRRKSGQQSEVRRASAQLGSCRIEIQEIDVVLVDPDFENYLLIDFCQGCRGEEAWRRQEIRRVMAARTAWRD